MMDAYNIQPYLAVTIAAMARLVNCLNESESSMEVENDPKWTGFHNTRCTSEDLYRAFCAIKFVERQKTKDKKNFLITESKKPAIQAKYLSKEQVLRAIHGHQEPTEQTNANDRVVDLLHQLADDLEAPGLEPTSDARFDIQIDADWSKIAEKPQVLGLKADKVDSHQFKGSHLNRDPMTAAQQVALCKYLGSKVQVRYADLNMGMQEPLNDGSASRGSIDPRATAEVSTSRGSIDPVPVALLTMTTDDNGKGTRS